MEFEDDSNMFMLMYCGVVFLMEDDCYQKYLFDEIEDDNLCEIMKVGWVGMFEYYFVLVWVFL